MNKYMKGSVMSNEIANQNIKNTAKNVKTSEKLMVVIKEMEKLLKVTSAEFYGLPTNKVKYFKHLH